MRLQSSLCGRWPGIEVGHRPSIAPVKIAEQRHRKNNDSNENFFSHDVLLPRLPPDRCDGEARSYETKIMGPLSIEESGPFSVGD